MPRVGVEVRFPEVAPSVSINNPAPYRPCAGQANFLGYEAAARRPMGIHMCTVRMPITPTYRGRGRGVSWPLVGVTALHSCLRSKAGGVSRPS